MCAARNVGSIDARLGKHYEGWTVATVCKAHECGDNNVTIAVNRHGPHLVDDMVWSDIWKR